MESLYKLYKITCKGNYLDSYNEVLKFERTVEFIVLADSNKIFNNTKVNKDILLYGLNLVNSIIPKNVSHFTLSEEDTKDNNFNKARYWYIEEISKKNEIESYLERKHKDIFDLRSLKVKIKDIVNLFI